MPDAVLPSRRVLVTGAAGFIGYHLVRRLLGAGAIVHGLDSFTTVYDVGLKRARLAEIGSHERFSFAPADITD